MNKIFSSFWIVLCFFFVSSFNVDDQNVLLTLKFENIRNNKGKLFVFVYNYENQYPDNPYLNFEIDKSFVSKFGTLKFEIPTYLAEGRYAVSVLDDENANEDLDLFLGLPLEGFAFSNNVFPMLSLPNYEDILVDVNANSKILFLKVNYIL